MPDYTEYKKKYAYIDSVLQDVFETPGTRNSDPKIYTIPSTPLSNYQTGITFFLLDNGKIALGALAVIPIPKNIPDRIRRKVIDAYKAKRRLYGDDKISIVTPSVSGSVDITNKAEIAGFANGILDRVTQLIEKEIALRDRLIRNLIQSDDQLV